MASIKKFFIFIALSKISALFSLSIPNSSTHMILLNAETGRVIFEKRGYERAYPASLTKLLTAICIVEKEPNISRRVTAPREALIYTTRKKKEQNLFRDPAYWLEPDGVTIHIHPGETFTIEQLLQALLIGSANDAANVLAATVFGSIELCCEYMNQKAKALGCRDSEFHNPHGLHHPLHYSTPYDMALILLEAKRFPLLREIMKQTEWNRPEHPRQKGYTVRQTNHLMREGKFFYPYAEGGKTGYHKDAGYNLLCLATHKGRSIASCVMKSPSKQVAHRDTINGFEAVFHEPKVERLLFDENESVFFHSISPKIRVKGCLSNPVSIAYYPSEEEKISVEIKWNIPELPIEQGACIGELYVLNESKIPLQTAPLYAVEKVEKPATYTNTILLGFGMSLLIYLLGKIYKGRKRKLFNPARA